MFLDLDRAENLFKKSNINEAFMFQNEFAVSKKTLMYYLKIL